VGATACGVQDSLPRNPLPDRSPLAESVTLSLMDAGSSLIALLGFPTRIHIVLRKERGAPGRKLKLVSSNILRRRKTASH
jgi:hypothetical protein